MTSPHAPHSWQEILQPWLLAESAAPEDVPDDALGPVAVVAVDVSVPHLDRPFEYDVPEELSSTARPGVRVKVRFSGRDISAVVLARRAEAQFGGRLSPLRRVVSPEVVLTARTAAVVRRVADDQAGTFADVLRLAVPPRHATAERALDARTWAPPQEPVIVDESAWSAYPAGPTFLHRLAQHQEASAAWTALPGHGPGQEWPDAFAAAAAATVSGGRGALLVVPDAVDVSRVDAALTRLWGAGRHVCLTAAQGPQARYTAWLKVLRGQASVVVGTRAAAFAPVRDLGLVAWWDDGDSNHVEPRAPYPHVRQVLQAQAALSGASCLVGGFTRSVAVAAAVARGEVKEVRADAATVRAATARIHVAGETVDVERHGPAARAHLPSAAFRVVREVAGDAPVLVQVPRRGYVPALSCTRCRTAARCPSCSGPLAWEASGQVPSCRWCGARVPAYVCASCGGQRLRGSVVGAQRTAEEVGRAFPGVPVRTSDGADRLEQVSGQPSLVIATPGAEPVAEGGYGAALLLDAWAGLDRPELEATPEALRRWMSAAALVRPRGSVVLAGVPEGVVLPVVEALVRWAPEWLADRELAERESLQLPPAVWVASVRGPRRAVRDLVEIAVLPAQVDRLGPIPVAGDDQVQLVLRAPWAVAAQAARAVAQAKAIRSARRPGDQVHVKVGVVDV
ncbi:putative primosomal protein N' [Austwickia sp. TVS 96-490-7B]|uniref:primosomal protein N' family DNA-binding protein n=1 Tax=Austwickia sp. TVS 96-490-7B TaxID=2830843 RepID=UPI001C5882AC|nr:primosome assembly protein PriA [Austwickia sp. TVS 96-490-7B]MBW3086041.1 putative primosomal protein N' [Austwickia sp. TVS 96-490-7B]